MKAMHASQTPSTATLQPSPSGWLRSGLLGALLLAAPLGFADSGVNHRVASPLLGTSGSSIEHILDKAFVYCYTGTLGALVKDAGNNAYILSNNHVLAKENNPDSTSLAPDGYNIIQPGLLDQATCTLSGDYSTSIIGRLTAFVPLNFNGTRKNPGVSAADAAIAQNSGMSTTGEIMDIGRLTGPHRAAQINEPVQKSGRTTGRTFGTVKAVNVTVDVQYDSGISRFNNQVEIVGTCTAYSDAGDSGSLIVTVPNGTAARTGVGLLFAGGGSSTFANQLADAFTGLQAAGAPELALVHDGTGNVDDSAAIPTCTSTGGSGKPGKGGGRGALDSIGLQVAQQALQRNSRALFAIEGVLGHGMGASDDGPVIRVYVDTLKRRADRGIPSVIEGIPVEVVVTGSIRAY